MPLQYARLMSDYNRWMNQRIFAAASQLSHAELIKDRQAFFPSILHTLSHIAVGDTLWLKRFATHPSSSWLRAQTNALPQPEALTALLFDELSSLQHYREQLDQIISDWVVQIDPKVLDDGLSYHTMAGKPFRKLFGLLLSHFFNHQTHHRGQVSTLLFQAGVDIGLTDLLGVIPECES